MPSLTQFTICFSMKSDDSSAGTPFSYAVSGSDNELIIYNYGEFHLFISGDSRLEFKLDPYAYTNGRRRFKFVKKVPNNTTSVKSIVYSLVFKHCDKTVIKRYLALFSSTNQPWCDFIAYFFLRFLNDFLVDFPSSNRHEIFTTYWV